MQEQKLEATKQLGDHNETSVTLHNLANIYVMRGDLDEAMQLYQQALEIDEGRGNLHGEALTIGNIAYIEALRGNLDKAIEMQKQKLEITKILGDRMGTSAALNNLAGIYFKRGDLDGAMQLYQQALEIKEELGNLEGKAVTLGMMSQVYWAKRNYKEAITSLLRGLMQLVELKIEPSTQQGMASDMAGWRNELGAERFDVIWKEITGQDVPDWLSESPHQQEQGMTAEQFITGAIQSARGKRPEAEKFFKAAGEMAVNSDAPEELRALGKVLQRIMLGDKEVDLFVLTEEMRKIIGRMKDKG